MLSVLRKTLARVSVDKTVSTFELGCYLGLDCYLCLVGRSNKCLSFYHCSVIIFNVLYIVIDRFELGFLCTAAVTAQRSC